MTFDNGCVINIINDNGDIIKNDPPLAIPSGEKNILKYIKTGPVNNKKNLCGPLVLKDHQHEHYTRINQIFGYAPAAIDCSPMGQGKTCIALKYAIDHNLTILPFCDVSMKKKIEKHGARYGARVLPALSYSALRGTSRKKQENITVGHKYLVHMNNRYYATQELVNLIESGVLILFDEFQALKNKSLQYFAALEIARTLAKYRGNGNSRVIYLSKTGIDDYKLIENVVTLLCLTPHDHLVEGTGEGKQAGYNDIVKISMAVNPDLAKTIAVPNVNYKSALYIVFGLYTNILKYFYSSSMPELNLEYKKDAKNCYYYVPDDQAENISKQIKQLDDNIIFNPDGKAVFTSGSSNTNMNNLLMDIEIAKVPLFCRLVRDTLSNDPNGKVIVSLNYRKSVETLRSMLIDVDPLVITGSTPAENHKSVNSSNNLTLHGVSRDDIIDGFQNEDNYRVLILSRVCRVGVDLDDQDGDRPRTLFISPSFSYTNTYQMTGRVYRTETKSDVVIRSVYAYNPKYHKSMRQEMRILQALHRKNKVTKDMSTIDNCNNDVGSLFTDEAIYEDGIDPENIASILDEPTVINWKFGTESEIYIPQTSKF